MNIRCRPSLRDVVADGRLSDVCQDPPNHRTVYILPGDVWKESYRLSTFEQYPITCSTKRRMFARSGFFYTGFTDRVKCFACGTTVEKLEDGDNPTDKKWHKQDCAFTLGQECGNIPLPSIKIFSATRSMANNSNENCNNEREHVTKQQKKRCDDNVDDSAKRIKLTGGTGSQQSEGRSHSELGSLMANVNSNKAIHLSNLSYNREFDRLASFGKWPVQRPSPSDLAKSGFFYLGDSDRTQCFSCGEVLNNWSPDDDVAAKHARHSPECKMSRGNETHNVPVCDVPETTEERELNYPCRLAATTNMKTVESRVNTFNHQWPKNRTNVTPMQLADAGFFYLGDRDIVRCWYCDGILHDWERNDDPWEEHAKWFPQCQFLLRNKGLQFVYCHLKNNAHLPRRTASKLGCPPPAIPSRNAREPPTPPRINPQEEERLRQERVHSAMENSEVIKVVLDMGFGEEIVATQLENMISSNQDIPDSIYTSALQLVVDLLQNEDGLKRQVEEKNRTGEDLIFSAKEEGWKEAMQKLADERMCKVCLVYPHDSVFIPCGHLCCCLVCALCLKTCPICRRPIKLCVPTYEP